jgi:enoyl-CoA hydratase/carnithine racemase
MSPLDRPEALNAFDDALLRALVITVREAAGAGVVLAVPALRETRK